MTLGGTIKCPICGRPYKWYAHYAGDQSACPACRAEAEAALVRPDTPEQIRSSELLAVSGDPFPKSSQLARGERRYRRRVASPQQWQALRAEKIGPCRVCCDPASNGRLYGRIQLHHLLSRAQGGDDVADNLAPLCPQCHDEVGRRNPFALRLLAESLTDAEYAYLIGKLGEGALERLSGVGR